MNPLERRAVFSLAGIFALRMLGLFIILPVFALYAAQLPGATPLLIGLAMGIYGFTQAALQIPLGLWSDRIGRKPVIALGLVVFIIGSICTAMSHSIMGVVMGRALQGAGAVGSATMALVADLTRSEQRTRAMAMVGISIGAAFMSAMAMGPVISTWLNIPGLLWLTAGLGGIAMVILYGYVPAAPPIPQHEKKLSELKAVFSQPGLLRLNGGIFILHAIFTASFIAIPIVLKDRLGVLPNDQWQLYLPTLISAALLTLPILSISEKKGLLKSLFLLTIVILGLSELLMLLAGMLQWSQCIYAIILFLFFVAFTVLEACLPAAISKIVIPSQRGSAMGIYSSCQFLGIFCGGLCGGWLYGHYGVLSVFMMCVIGASVWLSFAMFKH